MSLFTLHHDNWSNLLATSLDIPPPYHRDSASAQMFFLPGIWMTVRSISWVAVRSHMFLATLPRNESQERPDKIELTTAILSQWITMVLPCNLCLHNFKAMKTLIISKCTMVQCKGRHCINPKGIAYTYPSNMPPTPDRLASTNMSFTGGLECLSKYTLPLKSGKKALNQDTSCDRGKMPLSGASLSVVSILFTKNLTNTLVYVQEGTN